MTAVTEGLLQASQCNSFHAGAILIDALFSSASATQTAAVPLTGTLHRSAGGAATSSYILKSMVNLEAPRFVMFINDGPHSANVYPAVGETMNGSANAALSVAAGAVAFFIRSKVNGVLDWRAGAIT